MVRFVSAIARANEGGENRKHPVCIPFAPEPNRLTRGCSFSRLLSAHVRLHVEEGTFTIVREKSFASRGKAGKEEEQFASGMFLCVSLSVLSRSFLVFRITLPERNLGDPLLSCREFSHEIFFRIRSSIILERAILRLINFIQTE